MDATSYQPLSWIPWKKMNVLIPIKKKPVSSQRNSSQFSKTIVKDQMFLPKLKVKKLHCIFPRHSSPNPHPKKKFKNRFFSPVLNRGGTADFTKSVSKSP